MFTITAEDFPPKHKKWIRPGAPSLRTDDIEGAQPYLPGYRYRNKPDLYNVNDIEKASPQPRHRSLNKPEYNLQTSDIPNASPNAVDFKSNRIGNNPLAPVYNLPSYENKPITPPRFIRDHISIDDIDGTKPQIFSKWQTRNSADVADIAGATVKQNKDLNKPNFMNPKDINYIELFESTRKTNPLMPEYLCRDDDNNVITIGHVEGSSPRVLVNKSQSPHSRHLNTKDIEGATSGTVGVGPIGTKLRNYIRSPTDTQDIEGAQTGTFKKGITTVRITNPLDPQYTWLTEEPSEIKKQPEALPNDKFFIKNQAKFWGATPPFSKATTREVSKAATPINHEFQHNVRKFFGTEATPNTLQHIFDKNAEKFYSSLGKPHEIHHLHMGSIHRPKPVIKNTNFESDSYIKNTKEFFDAFTDKSPSRQSRQSEKVDPEFRYASEKSYRESPLSAAADKKSSISRESQDYKFSLSRAEIAKPNTGNTNGEKKSEKNNEIGPGSQRKSMSAVGKQYISS